ncbi:hypothetical protein, conserved [Eimeria brunetti]|uniref:Uncharacterized protein n=1 Tax=Eimeria brunetti TaxID=51314 RepID=U6LKN7_9EIME|nr:hypothetical protein, conserved [Eimeria brunetti]
MVDSPFTEELLSATQPATTPAIPREGEAPRGDDPTSVHATLVVERDSSVVSLTPSLSSLVPASTKIIRHCEETEHRLTSDLYPSLMPLPTTAPITHMRRSSAHSEASISPFRLAGKGLPDEADSEQRDPPRERVIPDTSENIDPVQHQMEQQQEAEATLKNGRPSFAPSSVERIASSRCSSLLLEEMPSPRSPEAAPFSRSAGAEQHEGGTSVPEQPIDAAWRRHVRSLCSTTSSLDSSVSDLRLREETRRNTKRNASPLTARNLRAQLLQRQQQQGLRKSDSPLRPQQASVAASASAPVTPLRFHVASWQQRKDRLDGHTPPRPEHTGAVAASSAAAEAPAAASVAAEAATPTAERPTTHGGSVRSILRGGSASGSSNSISSRRVVFTPIPKPLCSAVGEGKETSPWLDQDAAADEQAAPGGSIGTPKPAEGGAAAPAPDCGEPPPPLLSESVPIIEQIQHQEEQQQAVPGAPTESSRHPSEDRRRGSANGSSERLQQPNEQLQPCGGRSEAQLQLQQHRGRAEGDAVAEQVHLEAEAASQGMAAADAAAATAATMNTDTQETRAHPTTEAATLGESTSEPAPPSTTEAPADLEAQAEVTDIAVPVHEPAVFGPAIAGPTAEVVNAAAAAAETGTNGDLGAEAVDTDAAQVLQVPSASATQVSVGEAEVHPTGEPPAAESSDGPTDSLEAGGGSVSYCSSSTRVLVVSSEGESELLLQSASCLVAPTLSEPLCADPTPLRKAPARPPTGPEARSAAAARRARVACVGASPVITSIDSPAAAGAIVDASATTGAEEMTPQRISEDEANNHREQAAAGRHLPLQQQQEHGQAPMRTLNEYTGVTPESGLGVQHENLTGTEDVDACSSAAVSAAAPGLVVVQTDATGGHSNPLAQAGYSGQQSEKQQQQQQQNVSDEAELASVDGSETSSTPVTPFAGPDPLSGDAPFSPRLAVPSGRGGSRIVSTSAMSFLLSVRHQLEAEAAVQQDRQPQQQEQGQRQLEQQEEGSPSHDLHEPSLGREGCEATEKDSQADQQKQQQGQLEQQEQQQVGAKEQQRLEEATFNPPGSHEQRQEVEGVRIPGLSQVAAEGEGDDAVAGVAVSDAAAAATSSRQSSGAQSEASDSQAAPFTHACRNSDPRSADLRSTNSCISSSSEHFRGGVTASPKAGNSSSSNPPWRTQWKELDALTSRLLQGLPRALTVIAEEEGNLPAAVREPEAVLAVAPSAPETKEAGTTELSGEVETAISHLSWVDYREERLRELCEKGRPDIGAQCEDIDNSGVQEGNEEFSEVQQVLKHRLMKRSFGVASATAEELLMQPAKTRSEWKEVCARTEESLQQQLRHQIEPLAQHMTRDLQQLEEVLEATASRAEGAAEAKRLRLSRESWESGFIALAEQRHVGLQAAAGNVDARAASLGHMLEQETQLAEEIAAMKAEIRGFENTSDDLRLLADIRHKESIVKAFERLSGVRIQRVSTTGLVAELAWPRSRPAAAALQIPVDTCARDAVPPRASISKPFGRLHGTADYPAASTRITISWSREETQQTDMRRRTLPVRVPVSVTTNAAAAAEAAAANEPATPTRQRVQILKPCLPPGGLPTDSAVCTPLLAPRRGRAYGSDKAAPAGAAAPTAADAAASNSGIVLQWNQPQPLPAATGEPRSLPITSCKLQSRFPVLRAVAAVAASGTADGAANAEALPPHRRWMFTVDQLRYFLLGAVQRSLQQILLRQGSRHGVCEGLRGAPTARESFCDTRETGAARVSHLPSVGMRGLSGSDDISSRSPTESGSSSSEVEAAEGRHPAVGTPPFPDLSTVRALLLHAHAAAGRAALLHDQLLLLLHAFTSVTSVDCKLSQLNCATETASIDLSEALTRGSLLLAVEAVEVKCLSALDDMCTDGQEACKALHSALMARLEVLWDSEKQTLSSECCIKAFSDEGLVECLYSACDECGYSRAIEDWRRDHGASTQADDFAYLASWGSAEAGALERWTSLLEDAGIAARVP